MAFCALLGPKPWLTYTDYDQSGCSSDGSRHTTSTKALALFQRKVFAGGEGDESSRCSEHYKKSHYVYYKEENGGKTSRWCIESENPPLIVIGLLQQSSAVRETSNWLSNSPLRSRYDNIQIQFSFISHSSFSQCSREWNRVSLGITQRLQKRCERNRTHIKRFTPQ